MKPQPWGKEHAIGALESLLDKLRKDEIEVEGSCWKQELIPAGLVDSPFGPVTGYQPTGYVTYTIKICKRSVQEVAE